MDGDYDVVDGYLPFFTQHVKNTVARLGLRAGSQAHDDGQEEVNALSGWTSAEQDAFFRAVSVHSRWRPDLISACVPTRTEWEVWMYLEALEKGAMELSEGQADENDVGMADHLVDDDDRDVEMADENDAPAHAGSDADDDVCEPALEVSQAWIDAEERMAAWIIREEHLASVLGEVVADVEEEVNDEPQKRKRGRLCGRRKRVAQSRSRDQTVSSNGSPSPVYHSPSPEWTPASAREASQDEVTSDERRREALMSHLDLSHLMVLDTILNEDEETMMGRGKNREGSVAANVLTELGDDGMPRGGDADVSSLSGRITGPSNVSFDAVIDPVLLALNGGARPTAGPSDQVAGKSTTTRHAPLTDPAQGPSRLSNSSPQLTRLAVSPQPGTSNAFASPQDSITAPDPDPTTNAELDLSSLSPHTRRRIQKRFYMRRRRLRGNGGESAGTVDASLEKLKPGRKVKSKQFDTSAASTPVPGTEAPSDGEEEVPENVHKKYKQRGLTLPYKLKGEFAEVGVDATYLRGQGMDLLNLGALGRLMGLYSSLGHEEEEEGEEVAGFIDAQVIRYLQAAMVSFVTDIIHKAVVWREGERRLKQRSQVWRQGDQMTLGAVEHAVEVVGARYQSHKAYFKSLEAIHGRSTERTSAPGYATEKEPRPTGGGVDPDAETADLPEELPGLSPHRDVYTPLVYASKMSPLDCLTQTYEREATRTRRGMSADVDEELMSDETDEEALETALRDEAAADVREMAMAERAEGWLWARIR